MQLFRHYVILFFLFCILYTGNIHAQGLVPQIITDKGVSAWLLEDSHLPIVLLKWEFAGAGSSYDSPNKAGLAMIATQMLSEGAGAYPSSRFHEMLDLYAIDYRATIDKDRAFIEVKTLREHLPIAMELVVASLTQPQLDAEALHRIKTEHLSNLQRAKESPAYHVARIMERALWGDAHPYGMSPMGEESTVASITAQDVRGYIAQHFTRSAMQLSVAGDVDAQEVQELIVAPLSVLAQGGEVQPLPKATLTSHPAQHHVMDVPQTQVRVVYQGIERSDPLFYAAYLVEYMLGGSSLSSQLGNILREERGLVYGVSASLQQLQAVQWLSIDFATKASQTEEAIRLTKETVQKMTKGSITEEALHAAKDYMTGSFALATDSNAERVAYLSMMQRLGLGADYLAQRNALIERVTLAEIQQVAKRLLSSEPLLVVTVGE